MLDDARQYSFPEIVEECRGLAEVAGDVGFTEDLCLLLAYADGMAASMGSFLSRSEALLPACSQAVAAGDATLGGALVHARSMDWDAYDVLLRYPVVFVRQPTGLIPHVFIGFPGNLSPFQGMNAAGLSIASNKVDPVDAKDVDHTGRSNAQLQARILARASTLDEALAVYDAEKPVGAMLSIVSDGQAGRAVAIERTTRVEGRSALDRGVLWRTNHFVSPEATGADEEPSNGSRRRYDRIGQLISPEGPDSRHGRLDGNAMVALLRDRINPWTGEESPPDVFDDGRSIATNGAIYQVVFEPAHLRFRVAAGAVPVPRQPFVAFSLPELLSDPPQGVPGRDHCFLVGEPPAAPSPVILFGDLHAHSSNSLDALVNDLPVVGGRADRDPALRYEFARHCAGLDFWALVDHAEEQTAEQWAASVEAVRTCNDRYGGYPRSPRMVTFPGWEWTPNTDDVTTEWGHRNVVLPDTCDASLPLRPLASASGLVGLDADTFRTYGNVLSALDPENKATYERVIQQVLARFEKPDRDPAADPLDLPRDCHEVAATPPELFRRLSRWPTDALVVPHGLSCASNDLPQGGWSHQFGAALQDPVYVKRLEVYSGHGNSEELRAWSPVETKADDWLDCAQCRDCFQPARDFRPAFSAQAALARTEFSEPPWRFCLALIGSTDSHRAGPGAGYKERKRATDGSGAAAPKFDALVDQLGRLIVSDFERQGSYYYSGGLVAVHADGRDCKAIWQALRDRRVYATSGERIELWFDLVNGPGGERRAMGSDVMLAEAPRFEVSARGAFEQQAGCPVRVAQETSPGFVTDVCFGECYNPLATRYAITRIEVVKVTPCRFGWDSVDDDCLGHDEERAWSSPIYVAPE